MTQKIGLWEIVQLEDIVRLLAYVVIITAACVQTYNHTIGCLISAICGGMIVVRILRIEFRFYQLARRPDTPPGPGF